MAVYKISGVWKDNNNVITYYAVHTVQATTTTRAKKMSKAETIRLVETAGNIAYTWMWNYQTAAWQEGEKVEVVNGVAGKYLRSNRDNKLTDNLQHLIDFDWIAP